MIWVSGIRKTQQNFLFSFYSIYIYYIGCWLISSGLVDAGEGLEQAALRELKEELGMGVSSCQGVPYGPGAMFFEYAHDGANSLGLAGLVSQSSPILHYEPGKIRPRHLRRDVK